MAIKKRDNQGFTVIELLMVIFIVTTALFSLFQLYNLFLKISQQNKDYNRAVFLAQEALESTRSIRDESWANIGDLTEGTPYHPVISGDPPKWTLVAEQESIGNYSRQIVFAPVFRDANDNIIETGGTVDPKTKKVTATITWTDQGKDHSVDLATYLTDWNPYE